MSKGKIAVNRPLVGILAAACLAASGGLAAGIQWHEQLESRDWAIWQAAFLRVGLLMSAFWIALPSRDREAAWANVSPWTFIGLILAVVAVAARPRVAIPMFIVLGILSLVLRPRSRHRPPRS